MDKLEDMAKEQAAREAYRKEVQVGVEGLDE